MSSGDVPYGLLTPASSLAQVMFLRNRAQVQLTVELLDTEGENSDEPMEAEVSSWSPVAGQLPGFSWSKSHLVNKLFIQRL